MTEGQFKWFLYEANDSLDNDTLTCYWYINGSIIIPDDSLNWTAENPDDNCNTTGSSGWWRYPVSYDAALNLSMANVTIMLIVEDPQGYTANASVNMTVLSGNRAPRLNQTIQSEIKWYNKISITPLDLDDFFVDDYGEELSYSYVGGANVQISIPDSHVTLTPVGDWTGTSWVIFVANDSQYNTSSNNVTLIVEYQPPEKVPVPITRNTFVPKVASMEIIVDKIVKTASGNTSRANVTIYNDGQYDLRNIRLNVTTNETNITLSLQDTFVSELRVGGNATTWLFINAGELDINRTYYAVLTASAESPKITESATITIKPEPSNATKAFTEIVMVKDLFGENPECMELFGLITSAEESLKNGDITEAMRLTKLAVDNCQDMIDYAKLSRNETAPGKPSIVGQIFLNPFFVMGFILAVLALGMAAYWITSRRQQVLSTPKTVPKN
jgi:hypothetical protein